jgi:hypothetical protein
MKNIMLVIGLGISLVASIFMAYGKVFRTCTPAAAY